jgi:hypothetical protein
MTYHRIKIKKNALRIGRMLDKVSLTYFEELRVAVYVFLVGIAY